MKKSGQNNFLGLKFQTQMALIEFLEYVLRRPDFSYIHLEHPKWNDFNLYFENGSRIICEVKYRSQPISLGLVKEILQGIDFDRVRKEDTIKIITTKASESLLGFMKDIRNPLSLRFNDALNKKIEEKNISKRMLKLLQKTEIKAKGFSKEKEDIYYMEALRIINDSLSFWAPQRMLDELTNQILYKEIFQRSAKGREFSRKEYFEKIEKFKSKKKEWLKQFEAEKKTYEEEHRDVLNFIKNEEPRKITDPKLFYISATPALGFLMVDKIKEKSKINLQDWDIILDKFLKSNYVFSVFDILKKQSLLSKQNTLYFISFFEKHYNDFVASHREEMLREQGLGIIINILEKYASQSENILDFIEKILKEKGETYKKHESKRLWKQERQLIGQILEQLFNVFRQTEKPEKIREIIKLINNHFNLIADEGTFSTYTPKNIFIVLKKYIKLDFENNFNKIVNIIIKQYQKESDNHFDGWEVAGAGISRSGDNFSIRDRHFIDYALKPAVKDYYKKSKDKNEAWNFIKQQCIVEQKQVAEDRPDFLNRTVLPVVLKRYTSKNQKQSDEAFKILKEFILSQRGIPPKAELIYQAVRNNKVKLSDDKKWKLIKVSINKYDIPMNPFVEEIVSNLATRKHKQAREEMEKWIKNPKYFNRFRIEIIMPQNIRKVLKTDFDYGVKLFKEFIDNEKFIKDYDRFEVYKVSYILYDILKKKPKVGLDILNNLAEKKKLSPNQQIILCFSLFNRKDSSNSDDTKLLLKVYNEFLDKFLNNLDNDIEKITGKLSLASAREGIVQFADRLVRNLGKTDKNKRIEKALRIIEIFVNDPDPYLPDNDPKGPENEYNRHKRIQDGEETRSITSVRGWCCWALMKCPVLAGRDYISEIIKLTKQLAEDKNYYVKHMICFTLSQLAQNRLTVLPDNRSTLFFGESNKEALKNAKKVEEITFNLLEDIAKSSVDVKKVLGKSILHVFGHIRALNEEDASRFVNIIKKFPDESITEAAPLFIFFAEFRKEAFKDWRWGDLVSGLYDDLAPEEFNEKKFQNELEEILQNLGTSDLIKFVVQFEKLIRDADSDTKKGKKYLDVAHKYLNNYIVCRKYDKDLFHIVYVAIKEAIKKDDSGRWYKLYKKCLKTEKEFYKISKIKKTYWSYAYHHDILSTIFKEEGKKKFLEVFEILVSFPESIEISETEEIVSLLDNFSKGNKKAKNIVKLLYKRNSIKYHKLKEQWFDDEN